MTQAQVIEGTAEEVRRRTETLLRQYAGRQVKLIVLTDAPEQVQETPDGTRLPQRALTADEMIRALDALAEKSRDLPVLPSEAFERESIYEDI